MDADRSAPLSRSRSRSRAATAIPAPVAARLGLPRSWRWAGPRARAMLALVLASLVWGTADVAGKIALGTIPPVTLAALRFAVALAIFWPLARSRGVQPAKGGGIAVLGVIGVALTFLFQNAGLARTSAANASLLQGAAPVIVVVLAAIFLGEPLSASRLGGIVTALAGVAALTLASGGGLAAPRGGDLLVLASTGCFAAFVVLGRCAFADQGTLAVLVGMTRWGLAVLLLGAAVELALVPWPHPGWRELALVAYLGVGCSALTYSLWGFALSHLRVGHAAVFDNLIPAVGVAAAVLLLGERLSPWHLIGGALVVAGVVLSTREAHPTTVAPDIGHPKRRSLNEWGGMRPALQGGGD
jgi:drug/metabolite transporter (DMT)-like permease